MALVTPALELLELAERAATALPLPDIAQAVFPPDRKGTGMQGEFCALRLADGSVGTAFVLLGDTLARLQERASGELVGKPALEVARLFAADDPVERALGLAAINAITQHVFRRAGYEPDLATNSLGSFRLGPGDRIGMIGYFAPLIERVRAQGLPLTIVELRAELVRNEPGLIVTLDPKRLASCNKIVSTSTVLLNDTLEDILANCRHAEELALIGPSASCFPDPLFARGVTTMGGDWVLDPAVYMRRAESLEPWSGAGKKSCGQRAAYPGARTLLR
ncbi:MAG: Rossmann-like domain-containing protein, partial [Burkholderiales bacterium]